MSSESERGVTIYQAGDGLPWRYRVTQEGRAIEGGEIGCPAWASTERAAITWFVQHTIGWRSLLSLMRAAEAYAVAVMRQRDAAMRPGVLDWLDAQRERAERGGRAEREREIADLSHSVACDALDTAEAALFAAAVEYADLDVEVADAEH